MTEGEILIPCGQLFREHKHHLLKALTPDLKGLAEVVGLNEGNMYRSGSLS
jgi:hypothetical protein